MKNNTFKYKMPTEKELTKEYESLKHIKDDKIFYEICCLSLVEEEYDGEDLPDYLFSSFNTEYLTFEKFKQKIHDKIISMAHYDYEGQNPDELFLCIHHNIFVSVYRYKTIKEFVQERLREEEQKKTEQENEYNQYLKLKEKYDS